MIDIPAEAYEAAAIAIHDRECAEGPACTATPTSMTRYAELAKRAVDAVWTLAVAAGRDQAAADIRATIVQRGEHYPAEMQRAPWWNSLSGPTPTAFAEWAARIAERRAAGRPTRFQTPCTRPPGTPPSPGCPPAWTRPNRCAVSVRPRIGWQTDIFDHLEDGDPDGCSPYGCRSGVPAAADHLAKTTGGTGRE